MRRRKAKTKRSVGRAQPKLQRVDIRKSASRKEKRRKGRISFSLTQKDAFDFLEAIEPGSVDLIVSSPPYCMGKEYEKSLNIADFIAAHEALAPLLARALRRGGSVCWQVGHHVQKGVVTPLDAIVYPIFASQKGLYLRNRIVWTFGHGVHASKRFSGRHETILWFTKGRSYAFNLDTVRVPQKYPGKRHYKGPNKGEFSGNPKGKNPSDVWEIPNVKSRHIEKTKHPCQFPVALVQRLIRALTRPGANVVDPFMGSGTVALAAGLEGRSFLGCDIQRSYVAIARKRLKDARKGNPKYRPLERPISKMLLAILTYSFRARHPAQFFPAIKLLYKDSTWMATVGGYLGHKPEVSALVRIAKAHLPFLPKQNDDTFFQIPQFNVTDIERRIFDLLVTRKPRERSKVRIVRSLGFDANFIRQYQNMIRYIPRYFESAW